MLGGLKPLGLRSDAPIVLESMMAHPGYERFPKKCYITRNFHLKFLLNSFFRLILFVFVDSIIIS